jgi:hypothetical protein
MANILFGWTLFSARKKFSNSDFRRALSIKAPEDISDAFIQYLSVRFSLPHSHSRFRKQVNFIQCREYPVT